MSDRVFYELKPAKQPLRDVIEHILSEESASGAGLASGYSTDEAIALIRDALGVFPEDIQLLEEVAEHLDWMVKDKYLQQAQRFRSLASRLKLLLP